MARKRKRTPFVVSLVNADKSLTVVKSGFEDLKSAQNWCKKQAQEALNLTGSVDFFIFHAKEKMTCVFESAEDTTANDFDELISGPNDVASAPAAVASPLPADFEEEKASPVPPVPAAPPAPEPPSVPDDPYGAGGSDIL